MGQQQRVGKTATTIRANKQGEIEVIYHSTAVVTFNNETITLDNGGWTTNTTKARMNQASNQFKLGYRVYSLDYQWYVDYREESHPFIGTTLSLKR